MFRHHLLATTAVMAPAVPGLVAPAHAAAGAPSAGPLADCLTQSAPTCYAPRQFLTAYGIQPLLEHGIDGRGETIVMPEFVSTASTPGVTDVRADLAWFDSLFGLPPARLQIITRFAGASMPYLASGEEAGDIETAHEVAPGAAIRVPQRHRHRIQRAAGLGPGHGLGQPRRAGARTPARTPLQSAAANVSPGHNRLLPARGPRRGSRCTATCCRSSRTRHA